MKRGLLRISAMALVAAAAATSACAPTHQYNGFLPDRNNQEIPDPQVGVDTRDTVVQRFGSPSTTAVFDQTAWYYLSSVQESVAFYTPRITERRVMVIRFDGDTVAGHVHGVTRPAQRRGDRALEDLGIFDEKHSHA